MSQRIVVTLGALGLAIALLLSFATANASQASPANAAPMQTDPCLNPTAYNAIVQENCLPGTSPEVWDIDLDDSASPTAGAGDPTIQGFATDISVNRGSTIQFKIDTTASAVTIPIYRMGYYGGNGARLVATIPSAQVTETEQPDCDFDGNNGNLLDCGNWSVSASWQVPAAATSGVYFARPTRTDTGGASHIVFIVRDDASTSDIVFQTSDTTWQSYNPYGGVNAYGTMGASLAPKLSYNRPFATRAGELENWLFNAEYPMIRWLERNGYSVSYMAAVDIERHANLLTNHKVYLSVGHDEYWSQGRRDAVVAARDNGVHLAFFSANEIYWKTRWENDSAGQPFRTQVTYKEGNAAPLPEEHRFCGGAYSCDPTGIWTGLWRQAPGSTPENSVSGQISWRLGEFPITVSGEYAGLRFWRNTDVANLDPEDEIELTDRMLGYEIDPESPEYAAWYPAGRIKLSTTEFSSFAGDDLHHLSLYRHGTGANSALVFGAGSVQWSWGLDSNHDRGDNPADPNVQQATLNLLADMGVQPATRQTDLVAATASSDTVPPTTLITAPANGISVQAGPMTIIGTATDAGGGIVAGVEVSMDNGLTWRPANGLENWTFTGTPPNLGANTVLVRAVDDSGWLQVTPTQLSIFVEPRVCPCDVFNEVTPTDFEPETGSPVVIGVRFQSELEGYITAIKFYKESGNPGAYTGQIWDTEGTLLGSATFNTDASAGWQEAQIDPPVEIDANTTYVASYHSPQGAYIFSTGGFDTSIDNPPLHLPASTSSEPNGIYSYSSSPVFPEDNYQNSNYWIDVVFQEEILPDTTPPVVILAAPAGGATRVSVGVSPSATFNERLDETTITPANVKLLDGAVEVPATISYAPSSRRITIDPVAPLEYEKVYTVFLKGGVGGIENVSDIPLAANYQWTFTTREPPPPPPVDGPGGPILVIGSVSNPFTRYYAEILRAEGLNAFQVEELSSVTPAMLANYKVAILGEMAVTPTEAQMFTTWVNSGGNLISMRPDSDLMSLLGISAAGGAALANSYLLVETSQAPGAGIVNETIQYHGSATRYSLAGATSVATLYSNATTPTANPAVTLNLVGSNGGQTAAFAFDLARSVVYTRQGNPAWAADERDGLGPIRSNDKFFGAKSGDFQADWVDLSKVAIPQADEIQRLLANMITHMLADEFPLPRFWYFPRGEKAVVVMTHDEHGPGGVVSRLNYYNSVSPVGCDVDNWECIRSTTYMYSDALISPEELYEFESEGHEFATHVNTGCANYTPESLENDYERDLGDFENEFPGANLQVTMRTHCIAFSDWFTQPIVQHANDIRMDTNYYYWPGSWVQSRTGMFTGSGMPMRFADVDGTMIDVYQAATQMTDESSQPYPETIDQLLAGALGPKGYYGAFVANQHTDGGGSAQLNAELTIMAAQANSVPVITAKQLLEWTDARNASSVADIAYNDGTKTLTFKVNKHAAANGLTALIPATFQGNDLETLTVNGISVPFTEQTIKGVEYAQFVAAGGNYVAAYEIGDPDLEAPTILARTPEAAAVGVPVDANVQVQFSEPMNPATIDETTITLRANGATEDVPADVTYSGGLNIATLNPDNSLQAGVIYHVTVAASVADASGNILGAEDTWQFTTLPPGDSHSIFPSNATPMIAPHSDSNDYDLGVKFQSSIPGVITGIRFHRGPDAGAGPFVGSLWSEGGTLLGSTPDYMVGAPGWQVALFNEPIAIEANTTYITSYYTPIGGYSYSSGAFASPVTNGFLTALQTSGGSPNGVFSFGGGFPDVGAPGSNYWVDVVFDTLEPDAEPPIITARTPTPNATGVALNSIVTAQFNEAMLSGSINSTSVTLRAQGASEDVVAAVTYDSGTRTATLFPASSLAQNTVYVATVAATVSDLAGNAMGTPSTWQFTTLQDQQAPTILGRSPEPNATDVAASANVTVQFSEPMDANTISALTFSLRADGAGSDVPASVTYNGSTNTATLNPTGSLAAETLYNVTVAGTVADLAGNTLSGVDTWQFTTAEPPTAARSIWDDDDTPDVPANPDDTAYELGVKFRSSIDGEIAGIRFYRGEPGGTFRVSLWSAAGANLAEATAASPVSQIGWQEVLFASPVPIEANTTYVASYLVPTGAKYPIDVEYFSSQGAENPPLTALQSGVDGANGVFLVTGTGGFPDQSFENSNYWVDVVFQVAAPDGVPPTIAAHTPEANATAVALDSNVTVEFSEAMLAASINSTSVTLRAQGASEDVTAAVTYNSGTRTATLNPAGNLAQNTVYVATVAATVSDLAGNAMGTPSTWQFTTLQDQQAPTILGRSPEPNATDVAASANVTVQFSEPMDANTISALTFSLRADGAGSDVPASVTYNGSTNTATLNPTGSLAAETLYNVTVAGTVADLAGNTLSGVDTWQFTTAETPATVSVWGPGDGPTGLTFNDPGSNELGVRFRSDIGGAITGIRFFRQVTGGTFAVTLWNNEGEVLATATSPAVESTGWQEATFSSPVQIAADTQYVASYTVPPNTDYSATSAYFTTDIVNPPLTIPGGGGVNGVWAGGGSFPNQSGGNANYWVDVVFQAAAPDGVPPTITAHTPEANATAVALDSNVTVEFSEAMLSASINSTSITLRAQGATEDVSAAVTYNSGTRTATLNPASNLAQGTIYVATVAATVSDLAGNALGTPSTWQFTTESDLIPPTITARTPVPNATDVALDSNVTVEFSEAMLAASINSTSITLRAQGASEDVTAAVTYDAGSRTATLNPASNLAQGTVYVATVAATVSDMAANPLGTPSTWQFTTVPPSVGDSTIVDFAAGEPGVAPCYVSEMANGELILNPAFSLEFNDALPPAWVTNWQGENSVANVAGGLLTVDGAMVAVQGVDVTGGALEFEADFGNQSQKHVGFGENLDTGEPWAIFSTSTSNTNLYARVSTGTETFDQNLGSIPVGAHLYRIEWDSTSTRFYVDGVLAFTGPIVTGTMRPLLSDFFPDTTLSVNWMRLSPYGSDCTYTSTVKDAGAVVDWQSLLSSGARPGSTSVAFETRSGDVTLPDGTWSAWEAVSGNTVASPNARYIQYRATLATSDAMFTPVVADVAITYLTVSGVSPSVTLGLTWNLISLPRNLGTVSIQTALQPIDGDYALVYAFNACEEPDETSGYWRVYNPNATTGNTLTELDPSLGYWVFSNVNTSFEALGTPFANPEVELCAGWNLVGYRQDEAKPVDEVIGASCEGKVKMIYTFDLSSSEEGAPWLLHNPNSEIGNTIDNFEPGYGYWVYASEACTLGASE